MLNKPRQSSSFGSAGRKVGRRGSIMNADEMSNGLDAVAEILLRCFLFSLADRKSTRLNSSHCFISRMPSSA